MKIRTGDLVTVIAGKDRGKQGTVVRVLPLKNRVIVEGINMRVRHIKKTPQQAGQRVSYEASIHASNVMIIDPKTKKPTRIGFKIDEKSGAKKRIAKASGEVIVKAVTRAEKKTKNTGSTKNTKNEKQPSASSPSSSSSPSSPQKQPFWKRKEGGGKDDKGTGGGAEGGGTSFTAAHRSQGG